MLDPVAGHRRLRDHGESADVRATIPLRGFEPGAEPILREMRNGSFLLVFAYIPPRGTDGQPVTDKGFDLDTFGREVEMAAGVPVIWDDKEVFFIEHPRDDTVEEIRRFLENYWGTHEC